MVKLLLLLFFLKEKLTVVSSMGQSVKLKQQLDEAAKSSSKEGHSMYVSHPKNKFMHTNSLPMKLYLFSPH